MPNIAVLLKNEISRVARKEVRAETQTLKNASSAHRSEIAALKRRIQALEQDLRRVSNISRPSKAAPDQAVDTAQKARFSAGGLKSHRQRLGLSAIDFGALIGASALSVYKWESGKVHPQAKFLPAIAAVRSMGKKEANARILSLKNT